ncbi:MAG: DUF3445 domain-containing protein [Opitutus sp.]|nr:DUF3445 domain-containing protein [Opitutus sp.]
MTPLAELFPDGDYRFQLAMRRGEPREFFQPQDATGRVLAERARWLAAEPARHAALRPEGEPLLAEFAELCAGWKLTTEKTLLGLGAALEPDFLLLSPDATGAFCLRGGALCFPTGWALAEKIGHPLDFIHGAVPGLNAALASPIHQFLARLKPSTAFLRDNWGLTATDELNLHPARKLPPPDLPTGPDRLWLRVEHQALVALPHSGGVVFGLRIALHRLDHVARDPAAAAGLRRALATMPADVAVYKRLEMVRALVISWL